MNIRVQKDVITVINAIDTNYVCMLYKKALITEFLIVWLKYCKENNS